MAIGHQPAANATRRGERLFHDASASFQRWHSCATCHPGDGRQDALRWDFADDGLGNGMNTPTVLYPHQTEPLHRQGGLATTQILARHGLTFTHLSVPSNEQVEDLVAYMKSLKAEPSPHLAAGGKLSAAAERGRAIFEGKAECATCHQGSYFTDRKLYDVGVVTLNYDGAKFKTTPLVELYRSAPYLHDGRALTIQEVLTTFNPNDEHGKTKALNDQEIEDLAAYLLSL
jgi:cytochrome c peroxidase